MKAFTISRSGFFILLKLVFLYSLTGPIQAQFATGWSFFDQHGHARLDRSIAHSGKASLWLACTNRNQTGIGVTGSQRIRADELRGKRVVVSARVKSEKLGKEAQLFASAHTATNYAIWTTQVTEASTDWRKIEVVLDVPVTSLEFNFGASVIGFGEIWVDDFGIETSEPAEPSIPPVKEEGFESTEQEQRLYKEQAAKRPGKPVNLDFEGPAWIFATYTYKKVGEVEIKADVYRADDELVRPVVVWIHGGALIFGNRTLPHATVKRFLEDGYALMSIDYRLAPETKLPSIVEDLEDAFKWLRSHGPALFFIDPNRIGVWGGSAGGYLALASGHRVTPPPTVLVSYFGYGDLIGDWYSTPSNHLVHNKSKVMEAEARKHVSGRPIADDRDRDGPAYAFYAYCRQNGTWPQEVCGWDPATEREKYHPFMPIKNVSSSYPPTILVHGTVDTDVPFHLSADMTAELKKHGVPHILVAIENGEHGFTGADPLKVHEAEEAAHAFLARFLKK